MKKYKIRMGFVGITLLELRKRKDAIVLCMTGNAFFPTTAVAVAAIKVTGEEFDKLDVKIRAGDRTLIGRRDVVEQLLQRQLTELGYSVTAIAHGSYEALCSTGFGLYKERTPAGNISAPTGLKVSDNPAAGVLNCRIKSVKYVQIYRYAWTLDPSLDGSQWESKETAYVTFATPKLESGKRYWICVGAKDKRGNIVYCEPVSRVVQ